MGNTGLRAALAAGRFVVTAEIGPPRGADPEHIRRKAALLTGWVDAANITDNQGAHARVSSWAGSILAMQAGIEPVMQMTTRDRNRIALQSDLLSAGAMGIPNILLLTGDHPTYGDHPDALPVFDLDSVTLIWTAKLLRDEGRLLSGKTVAPPPNWLIGAVENPFAPPRAFRPTRMGKKVAAGAEFIQTQFIYDTGEFSRFMSGVRDLGLDQRCAVIAGVGPIRSVRALEFLQTKVPGIHVPDSLARRLRAVPSDRVAEEGMRACVEIIEEVSGIESVRGVHVMAFGQEQLVPELLERAGLGRRRSAVQEQPHAG